MGRKKNGLTAIAAAMGISATLAQAQSQAPVGLDTVTDFKSAVTQGVLTNPRVVSQWYNFEATREAERGARGGYLPSVDLYSEWGREERETPLIDLGDYSRDATRFTITQMLFDGFATRDQVASLGYAKLSRYYDFKRASEEIALEAAVAYLDTVKFQNLVKFAEDNYIVHKNVYDKIEERTGGGVSQGVDLEQAAARVALAESNLVTEITNLHDVMTRFHRVVGSLPGENLAMPSVPAGEIPELRETALEMAYQRSPVINAAIENLRSSQESLNATNAPMMPRLDLRYRNEVEHDTDGIDGRFDEEAIEVVVSYNLFRGGSDSARKREYYNLYNAAIEERKQACLNVRQEVTIAFNDVEALERQVEVLQRNLIAQDKTRRAYRDQFDIGQRTLLDLLDSQNEYFDTQRAHTSAVTDLAAAQARTLANMGLLLAAMDMDGLNAEKIAELDLDFSRDGDDENAQALCPQGAPLPASVDRDALFARLNASADPAASAASAAALAGLAAGSDRYRTVGEDMVSLEVDVQFEFNSSVISSAYDDEIARAAEALRDNAGIRATVEGHTDSSGEDNYNQWLSERRANAVRDMLINEHGISADQLVAIGRGEGSPIASNATAEGRARNRRVELVLDVAQ
ncbi:transporter [Seongchinamella sediminis]|uniref:Transporter n=1 Tax=Seongchinamella sediminis TaxID=2283635 RepID=A0A3L7E250_9GAMM|nr:TolC family outer membrane protein [Seongchinamella sediminis]RLQ23586.1 transporter [Seongchinamella sediminis]